MRFLARDVAAATGGTLVGPDVEIDGVSFDSRSLRPGQMFVPLIDKRDGHDFIGVALERGAAAYLTSRPAGVGSAIEVADTLQGLMLLAAERRRLLDSAVIGITGSVGKTTTKDLARAALVASRRTWANERSFNNDLGLPATILNAPDDTEVLVLEMGMRGFGEVKRLCDIARPQVGVITRVAEAHGDRVGGILGVAAAKAELVDALPAHGTAILNGDDSLVRAMATRCAGAVLLFGEGADCEVRVADLSLDHLARASFTVHTPWGSAHVALAVSGRHMMLNAAAALACVGVVGGDIQAGAAAMGEVRLTAMRMQVGRAIGGALVLNDSYNANPTSMRAALDALVALPAHRRFAVLGVMAEITDHEAEHRAIHAYAAERGVEVVAFGTALYGVTPIDDPVAALAALGAIGDGDAVLVKGSRVAGLERVADSLLTR
ncbi:MAG: murF [Acidimicrobiaceae bacterium]|nr:MAG: murF [Acidimicrobiaceae bacterium]